MCLKAVLSIFVRLLVTVVRTVQQSKNVRFLHVAFDTPGDSFLAGDHHGNIYVFDISRNRCDCGQSYQGLLARPKPDLSPLICLRADFALCKKQDRPALLWPSIFAEPQSSL